MSSSCVKHPMARGEQVCGECGHHFCHECVVFPFGTAKPPLCISCALELGGVRRPPTNRPKLSRRSIKERLAIQRKEARALTQKVPVIEPEEEISTEPPVWLENSAEAEALPGGWSQTYD